MKQGDVQLPRFGWFNSVRFFKFVSGAQVAGNVFLLPVRTPVEETIPLGSEPPGNSAEFQARAAFLLIALKSREADF